MIAQGESSVAAGAVRRVVAHALRRGLAPSDVEVGLGIPLATLDDPDARIEAERHFDLWEHLARRLDDPAVGVRVAEEASLEDLHVLGFAVLTAPTVADGLATFGRFGALLTTCGRWHVEADGARVVARFDRGAARLGHRLSNETAVAQFVSSMRQLSGNREIDGLRVSFRHEAPHDRAEHRAFFRCRVDFAAAADTISFSRALLDAVPPAAHRAMWAHFRGEVERKTLLLPRDAPGTASVVPAVIRAVSRAIDAGTPVELERIARTMGCSERTLRRRLEREGTTFRRVADDTRRARAETLLARADVSITRAGLEAGFADASAFNHACRRWFGCAPGEARARRHRAS